VNEQLAGAHDAYRRRDWITARDAYEVAGDPLHGFEVIGDIRAGDSPPLWPMLRPAR
jgi:hypothetical protein